MGAADARGALEAGTAVLSSFDIKRQTDNIKHMNKDDIVFLYIITFQAFYLFQ